MMPLLRFESCDWHSFVQHSFHLEIVTGLRGLTAFAEHYRLAIGDFAHLSRPSDTEVLRKCLSKTSPEASVEDTQHEEIGVAPLCRPKLP